MAKEKKFSLINCNHFKEICLNYQEQLLLSKYLNIKYKDVIFNNASKVLEQEKKNEENGKGRYLPSRAQSFMALEEATKLSISVEHCLDIVTKDCTANNHYTMYLNGIQIYCLTEVLGYIAAFKLDRLAEVEESIDSISQTANLNHKMELSKEKQLIEKELKELQVLEDKFRGIVGLGGYKKLQINFRNLDIKALISVCKRRNTDKENTMYT